jgi:hypothetical protein
VAIYGVRKTSIEAYYCLVEEGWLPKRQREVYAALFDHGPASTSELIQHLARLSPGAHPNVHVRLGELRDQGLVYEVSEDYLDQVTGRRVILWDVTDRASPLPVPLNRIMPKRLMAREWSKLLLVEILTVLGTDTLPPVITRDALMRAMLNLEGRRSL